MKLIALSISLLPLLTCTHLFAAPALKQDIGQVVPEDTYEDAIYAYNDAIKNWLDSVKEAHQSEIAKRDEAAIHKGTTFPPFPPAPPQPPFPPFPPSGNFPPTLPPFPPAPPQPPFPPFPPTFPPTFPGHGRQVKRDDASVHKSAFFPPFPPAPPQPPFPPFPPTGGIPTLPPFPPAPPQPPFPPFPPGVHSKVESEPSQDAALDSDASPEDSN
ncbi:hypothetical protein K501DRAFT_280145 [Backusella circina FSU 941]|nr:hypothetical protein K501DRAFT_280145 [Backusella circina FSU 941]